MPNWAEQVTAIGTAVSAFGLLSAIGAVAFAGRQAREARISRNAEMAVEFFRRWSEGPMLETRVRGRAAYPMFERLVTKMRAAEPAGINL